MRYFADMTIILSIVTVMLIIVVAIYAAARPEIISMLLPFTQS